MFITLTVIWFIGFVLIGLFALYRRGLVDGSQVRINDEEFYLESVPGFLFAAIPWMLWLSCLIVGAPGILIYRWGERRGARRLAAKKVAEATERIRLAAEYAEKEKERKLLVEQHKASKAKKPSKAKQS